jgi:hypothetical protein
MTTLKQFRWFWAWDDEKEEIWLREMANKGWHFVSISGLGNYTFAQGQARDVVYRLDHMPNDKDKADYVQLFQDAGWEYAGQSLNGWQYFRKEAVKGEAPDIFSDNESKARKYRNILLVFVGLLPIIFINMITLNRINDPAAEWLTLVLYLLFIVYTYIMFRLLIHIEQLTKKGLLPPSTNAAAPSA